MSAGYFPMDDSTDTAKKLLHAANLVQSAARDVRDSIYSGDDGQRWTKFGVQVRFDNSASDGGSLALLELAVKLIRGEVHIRQHLSDCAVHNEPAYPKGKCDCGYGDAK